MKKLTIEIFSVKLGKDGFTQWYFHIKSANGQIIAQSEGYKRRASCANTVRMLDEFAFGKFNIKYL